MKTTLPGVQRVASIGYLKLLMLASMFGAGPCFGAERLPDIVLILADDLGYGDVRAYNPQSGIATANIDSLAREGMRLTDAHATATCAPSRYALLTGRYKFRSTRSYAKESLIEPGRVTIASLLKQAGYATAMVGKWNQSFEGGEAFDYAKPLGGGPVDHGFDSFFGIHSSLDTPPYFYIERDRVVEAPTKIVQAHHSPGVRSIQGAFWRSGPIASGFRHEDVLPRLTERAVSYIESRAGLPQPFFLYLALTGPHPPWLPSEAFRGRSRIGAYGDFVLQVDDVVGRVRRALEKAGRSRDTLIIFTSDNGPVWFGEDERRSGHRAAGVWRGMKADAWEGGHRVPFIVRWPGKIAAGSSSAQLVSLADMLATFARITGQNVPRGAGEDSLDVLPVWLKNASQPIRREIVVEAFRPGVDGLAIRQGSWKLIPWIDDNSVFEAFGFEASDAFNPPLPRMPRPGEPQGQLYNLADDPGERSNVYARHPDVVKRLTLLLGEYRRNGRGAAN